MRIVAVSDVHGRWGKIDIPDGDVLVIAGDSTMMGRKEEIGKFAAYVEALPHKWKIAIAGNHDWLFETKSRLAEKMMAQAGIEYLKDDSITIDGVKFYGAPWQPRFHDWAFNVDRGPLIKKKWDLIPDDTNVLVTHGPPYGVLDQVADGPHLGCEELRAALDRVMPRLHIFGHIHDGYGQNNNVEGIDTHFINASICDESYYHANAPIVRNL